ncbi:hypothetical protein GCM10007897_43630 [Sphingobium jiangsuense]|uniref:Uncharacterized protein n=1 Tax=Sphingobium jiangsuense TaxID=870476 RepID=A0A7W6BVY9_9SPHN|nr:hypothetical protein [Sphingobium jiangsuense]MBB3928884.1 hypothetical protein [Sphingobium jiangsuense]GLT02933.1 hypothetical protein GCM10007897_43630 [Sphingobium jiangsuense]
MAAWTPVEVDILTAAYRDGGLPAAREALPHRSSKAITGKAAYLNLTAASSPFSPWTAEEDEVLRQFYRSEGSEFCARVLTRRSISAIRHRAGIILGTFAPRADIVLPGPAKPRPKVRRTFEQQLAAVQAGAKLERAWSKPVAAPGYTMAGVSADW